MQKRIFDHLFKFLCRGDLMRFDPDNRDARRFQRRVLFRVGDFSSLLKVRDSVELDAGNHEKPLVADHEVHAFLAHFFEPRHPVIALVHLDYIGQPDLRHDVVAGHCFYQEVIKNLFSLVYQRFFAEVGRWLRRLRPFSHQGSDEIRYA